MFEANDQEVRHPARFAEPALRHGDEVDVAFDHCRHAQALLHGGREGYIRLAKDGARLADTGSPLNPARQADTKACDLLHPKARVGDTALHAILDQIGNN